MYFIAKLIFLSWTACTILATNSLYQKLYEELEDLNATCYPHDSCRERHASAYPGIHQLVACSCDRLCSQFGTCCPDSSSVHNSIRSPKLKPNCKTLGQNSLESLIRMSYFMVDRCSKDDSAWEALCNDDFGSEENDIMRLVPVTSLFTSMTYKNYFCLRCHETTEDFLYWSIFLKNKSTYIEQQEADEVQLTYSNDIGSWMASLGNTSFEVHLEFVIPNEISPLPIQCEPDVISSCHSEWANDSIRYRCHAYMAIMHIERDGNLLKYRNAHCALCNFESLDGMSCKVSRVTLGETPVATTHFTPLGPSPEYFPGLSKVPFSFTHLLDINRDDGDRVGKIQRCEDGHLWDPFAKKCRGLRCALPGYVAKQGKCVPG